jgi:hypothetical protein
MADTGDDVKQSISIDISEDGIAASHPITVDFPKPVATSQLLQGTHNTLKDFLVVVGCSLVPEFHFSFDSSFPGPVISGATKKLARLREDLKGFEGLNAGEEKTHPPLAIFGHADPTGAIDYNSKLSQRRASAVYGMLIRDVSIWEELFEDKSLRGDRWGDEELGAMLDLVGLAPEFPAGSEDPEGRKLALKRLEGKGADSKDARAQLFRAYMNLVCVGEDEAGKEFEFELKPADFIARGAGRNAKGDVQGCGEFNPVLILSQEEIDKVEETPDSSPEKDILKAVRDAANEPNRRVIIFLFKPGTRVDPKKWPCPDCKQSQQDSVAACRSRLWSDSKDRLKPDKSERRTFGADEHTFACRFYHGFARNSPCEGALRLWPLRIGLDDELARDQAGKLIRNKQGRPILQRPIANKRFVAFMSGETDESAADAPVIRGRTSADGELRLPVFDEEANITLKIDAFITIAKPGDEPQGDKTPEDRFITLKLRAGDLLFIDFDDLESKETKTGMKQRLFNLGYGRDKEIEKWTEEDLRNATAAFQRKHEKEMSITIEPHGPDVPDSPEVTRRTLRVLRFIHGS